MPKFKSWVTRSPPIIESTSDTFSNADDDRKPSDNQDPPRNRLTTSRPNPYASLETQHPGERTHLNTQASDLASDESRTFYDNERHPSSPGDGHRGEDLQQAMEKFKHQLCKLKKEHPDLTLNVSVHSSPAEVVRAQQTLIEQFKTVTLRYHDANFEWNTVKKNLQTSINQRDRAEKDHRKELDEERKAAEKGFRKRLEEERKAAIKAEKNLRKEFEVEKKQAEKEMEWRVKDYYKFEIDSLTRKVREQKREVDLIQRISREKERTLLRTKQAEYEKLEATKDNEYAAMIERYDAEKTTMVGMHEAEKSNAVRELQEKIEDLKSALVEQVKKDHFKSMGDGAISNQFQGINNFVDEFSRVPWETSLESSWPYPNQAFQNTDNDRRTKQHIIQNTLWVVLYERIFCTPFRMLGMIGKSLEGQWIQQFQDWKPTGSLCPSPTKDSEKWRYETMKKCIEAINQKSGNDTKLIYEQSLKDTCDAMCQELEKITQVTSSDRQGMTELVKKAAKLWLEVGQQRYRVFVLMSDSGKEPARSSVPDHDGALSIVVTPGLRRLGNSQGDRLEKEETVMGYKGKFATEYILK